MTGVDLTVLDNHLSNTKVVLLTGVLAEQIEKVNKPAGEILNNIINNIDLNGNFFGLYYGLRKIQDKDNSPIYHALYAAVKY